MAMANTTKEQQQAAESGAKQVGQRQQMAAGMRPNGTTPSRSGSRRWVCRRPGGDTGGPADAEHVAQGQSVRVRVGDAHNGSEMFEGVFASAEEANEALVDAGVLSAEQVGDGTGLAGMGVKLEGVTAEALEAAGLKRHGVATL